MLFNIKQNDNGKTTTMPLCGNRPDALQCQLEQRLHVQRVNRGKALNVPGSAVHRNPRRFVVPHTHLVDSVWPPGCRSALTTIALCLTRPPESIALRACVRVRPIAVLLQ